MRQASYDQKSLLFRFKKHLETKQFCRPSGRYLIACSGGADSVALFYLMRAALPSAQLVLAHFNHGLRAKTALRDELFVKRLAQKFNTPFFSERAQIRGKNTSPKQSTEEVAREKRYAFLKKIYKKTRSQAVFLAHHLDDQAETVLMRICQGTGLRGLSAVREEICVESMRVVRPLLPFLKAEILVFLRRHGLDFCEDETNLKTYYLRNRIRKRVLPFLAREVNPQIVRALARISETVREENHFMALEEQMAAKYVTQKKTAKQVVMNLKKFRKLHPALQFRVLDWAAKKLKPEAGLLFEHAELIKNLLKKEDFSISLPRGLVVWVRKGKIAIQKVSG